MASEPSYRELTALWRERTLLDSCATLLAWDEETHLPPAGVEARAEQHALLVRLEHERATDPRLPALLAEAEAELAPDDELARTNLRLMREDHEQAVRVPASLVEELARSTTRAQATWEHARDADDVTDYLPVLDRVLTLTRSWADCVRGERSRYDACLDEWEPGLTEAQVVALTGHLVPALEQLVDRVLGAPAPPARPLGPIDVDVQRGLCRQVAAWIGFDLDGGRLDEAAHPSTMRIGPGDIRLTTRYDRERPLAGLMATLHEVGHGLYDQQLPAEHFGSPIGEPRSLGLHESQARLVENLIGRGHAFWRFALPRLAGQAPALAALDVDSLFHTLNRVGRTTDRVAADELTYDLHIAIRVELERALVRDDLRTADLPAAWDEAYARALVRPRGPADGLLQDGHWAAGMIGYFPTYTLGNLIAAQLWAAATRALGDLDGPIARGELSPLVGWLGEHVHRHAGHLEAHALVVRATGAPPGPDAQLARLRDKYTALYRL